MIQIWYPTSTHKENKNVDFYHQPQNVITEATRKNILVYLMTGRSLQEPSVAEIFKAEIGGIFVSPNTDGM